MKTEINLDLREILIVCNNIVFLQNSEYFISATDLYTCTVKE